MDAHKGLDYAIGTYGTAAGIWLGNHWIAALGAALVVWRAIQAFALEPMGIFWPRPRRWWRRGL